MPFEIQAHRGARAFYPENTLQAFCKAADLGCRVIELDLVISNDNRIFVSHDPWSPERTDQNSSRRWLYAMSADEIAEINCGMVSSEFPGQRPVKASPPALSDVFQTVEAHLDHIGSSKEMVYNLEVKSWPERDGLAHPVPEIYAALVVQEIAASGLMSRVRLQSFDDRIVRAAKSLQPALCCGLLVDKSERLGAVPALTGFVPEYVNPHYSLVDKALIERLHGLGALVVVWTVNRPEEMKRMKQLGADGIITDHPEMALLIPEVDPE